MSLFSSLGQRLLGGARGLFNQPQTPVDGRQQQPSTLQRFGIFNFSGNKTALSDETMHSLSASIPSDAGANSQLETAHLAATVQTSGSKTWRWGEGANKNGYIVTVTPKDVGLQRWGTIDPKIVTARAMEKAALKMGITNDPAKAKEIVGKMQINGLTTGSGDNQRMVKATDFAYKGWMQDRVDSYSNYAVQMRPEDVANLISSAQEVLGADFKPPTNVSKSQLGAMGITITGGAGVAASIALRGAPLVLPKLGAVAAPVVIAGAAGLPFAIVTSQYLKEVYDNGLARERDKIMPLPLPPNLTMEDIGDAPPLTARPTDTAERPKTKVTDLPSAPTDLVPTGNTKPQAKPEAETKPQAKPKTTVENLPQPYTPDALRYNEPQPQPPQMPKLPKGVPEIIAGAGGATIGKTAADMVKQDVAPNGVQKIDKREWSQAEYKQWFDGLPKSPAKTASDANIYQLIQVGETEFTISGNGKKFDADGLADKTVLEAKFVGNSARSPYIEDSRLPPFLRDRIDAKTRDEFARLSVILRDNNNPLTAVRVVTSDEKAVPYFEKLMREYNVPGEVVVKKEKDIEP